MNLLYAANPGSQAVRFGSPPAGLTASIPLSFAGHRIVVVPGQRYLYVTGAKNIGGQVHATLGVIDTCSNTVIREVDLGVGWAGQCAVPDAPGGTRAFVAVSQAAGSGPGSDTGVQGSNRVEVLDITNPGAPVRLPNSAIRPPAAMNNPFGFLHLVWSYTLNRVYASHRGDGDIYHFDVRMGQASLQQFRLADVANPQTGVGFRPQPTGLGISQDGQVLFVVERRFGVLIVVDLNNPVPQRLQLPLMPAAASASALAIAVSRGDQVFITSNRADGFLYLFQHPAAAVPQNQSLNITGQRFGQPALSPDQALLYIPRGAQNDLAQVAVATQSVLPGFLAAGVEPTDLIAIAHEAGMTLRPTTSSNAASCNQGSNTVNVRVEAVDSCGNLLAGIPIRGSVGTANISIRPQGSQPTPANFQITCFQGGAASANFSANVFPFTNVTVNIQCQCPQLRCLDFTAFVGSLLPGNSGTLGNVFSVERVFAVPPSGPSVLGPQLRLFRGGVRFRVLNGTVDNVVIHARRQDTEPPVERVTVHHAGGVSPPIFGPSLARGRFDLVCNFRGITHFEVYGGAESTLSGICFEA